jgi:hypothetical protein
VHFTKVIWLSEKANYISAGVTTTAVVYLFYFQNPDARNQGQIVTYAKRIQSARKSEKIGLSGFLFQTIQF